jgi:Cdc6-like AAA superfamily ATPase
MGLADFPEEEFRGILRRHFTPGRAISSKEFLRGRDAKLIQIDRAFNSDGKHIFIHGDRGVGKTSLARTAAFQHSSAARDPKTIECERGSTAYQMLRDIAMCCVPGKEALSRSTVRKSLKAGIPMLSAELVQEVNSGQIPEIKSMNEALAVIAYLTSISPSRPIIIIDEFDVIHDETTRHTFASFLKHVSDQEIDLRFIICGIGDSLDEMIGSHLSTGRYLMPIELERLSHDARWEILQSTADELDVAIDENARIRIGQISDGYPYYIHLIGEKLLWAMRDDPSNVDASTPKHFEVALREASAEAEPSLRTSYDKATQKYKNDYQEVLWAVADSSMLRRQIKDIHDSYLRLMRRHFPGQEAMEQPTFYNRMNALRGDRHGKILRTTSAGWYEFRENRLRGYVRLVAERSGVELEPEHHLSPKRSNRLADYREREDHR